MKKLFLALLVFLSLPAFARENESVYDRVMATHTLHCGYFVWPPYFNKDAATGAYSGVYYDMAEALGRVMNIKIDWAYEYTLGQQVEALKSGKVDALCGDGPFTRSAMPFVEYSHAYLYLPMYAYVAETNPKKLTFDRLNSDALTFTAMDGDGSPEIIQLYFPKAKVLSLPSTADPSLLIENVATAKADAMLSDPVTIEAQSKHNQARLMQLGSEKPLAIYPLLMSVDKGEQALLNMLNQGLDFLNDTGEMAQILDKYDPTGKKLKKPQAHYLEQK